MKKMKKLLSLTVYTLLAAALTACSSQPAGASETESGNKSTSAQVQSADYYNAEGYPICNEPLTLTVAVSDDTGLSQDSERLELEQYASKLGINLEIHAFGSEDYATQLTLMMANDEMYDLIVGSGYTTTQVHEYGEEGYLLNLADYSGLMPNLNSIFEKYPAYKNLNTYADGTIYGLVSITDQTPTKVFIDKNWLANVGMEVPATVDELYNVLKAFKEQDANGNGNPDDEIPMQYTFCRFFTDRLLMNAFGMTPNDMELPVDTDENGELRLTFMSENYKAYLQYLAKLYQEGLIDQECFSVSEDIITQKYTDDLIGFGGEWAPFATTVSDIATDVDVAYALVALTSDYSSQPIVSWPSNISDSNSIMVSADCQYPEAAVRFIDYLYTPEGAEGTIYGYEGISFKMEDIPGLGQLPMLNVPDGYSQDEYRIKEVTLNKLTLCSPNFPENSPYQSQFSLLCKAAENYRAGEIDEQTYESLRRRFGYDLLIAEASAEKNVRSVDSFPPLSYTEAEGKTRINVRTAITNYLADSKAQFIIGNLDFEQDWENYLQKLNEMGAEELLKVEQSAYARYMAEQ